MARKTMRKIILLLVCISVYAEDQPSELPPVQEWPIETVRAIARNREKFSQMFFDLLDDVTILNISKNGISLNVSSGRRVYENHDTENSYTVIDHFDLDLAKPLLTSKDYIPNSLDAVFHIDLSAGIKFTNIRQVIPGSPLVTTIKKEDIKEALSVQEFDGVTDARYGKIWNTIAVPCKTPFKAEWIDRLEINEIVTWNTHGSIEVGPSVGWSFDPFKTLNAGVSFRTYLHGSYQISIIKEDNTHARVKVSKKSEEGNRFTASIGTDPLTIGFTILTIRPNWLEITPFSFTTLRQYGNAFDVTYRYDLATDTGKKAFSDAVKGRFGLSDDGAGGLNWKTQQKNSPVYKIGNRDTSSITDASSSFIKYALILRHGNNTSVTSYDTIITLPNGVTHEFTALTENSEYLRWITGDSTKLNYSFKVTTNLDKKNSMYIVVSADIYNSDTSGREFKNYCDEFETAVNKPNFFHRPPLFRPLPIQFPSPNDEFDRRSQYEGPRQTMLYYGQSSFFYQITYTNEQLLNFINTPENKMWELLEQAFEEPPKAWSTPNRRAVFGVSRLPVTLLNLPGYIVNFHLRDGDILQSAYRVKDAWLAAQQETNVTDKITKIGEIFSDRFYGKELAKLMQISVGNDKVSYVIQGSSHVFGVKRAEGVGTFISPFNKQQEQVDFDFDKRKSITHVDPLANIKVLNITHDKNKWVINFEVTDKPVGVYIRLIEKKPWRLPRSVGEVVLLKDLIQLVEGTDNVIVESGNGQIGTLFSKIVDGSNYEVHVAYTRDGVTWGSVYERKFDGK